MMNSKPRRLMFSDQRRRKLQTRIYKGFASKMVSVFAFPRCITGGAWVFSLFLKLCIYLLHTLLPEKFHRKFFKKKNKNVGGEEPGPFCLCLTMWHLQAAPEVTGGTAFYPLVLSCDWQGSRMSSKP